MHILHSEFKKFHDEKVKLPGKEKSKIRRFKRINLVNLHKGLKEINAEQNKEYKILKFYEQGSVSMHTVTQNEENQYDIDVAVIFDKDVLPSSPSEARKVVEDALKRKCKNFSKEPEARTNAVTVWYQACYHIDFAVYRQYEDEDGNLVREHAGSEWSKRNPTDISDWFNNAVSDKSPKQTEGATVDNDQMRRMVRLLKMFCKSRSSWSLPGGLILSALVDECYCSDSARDDVAFYETMKAIRDRLKTNTDVYNPADSSLKLNTKDKYTNQIVRLKDRLTENLDNLSVLFESDCTDKKAKKAWKKFFSHDFWKVEEELQKSASQSTFEVSSNGLDVEVKIFSEKDAVTKELQVNYLQHLIIKGSWIRFTAKSNSPGPIKYRWLVLNEGDEAIEAGQLRREYDTTGNQTWEHAGFRGSHRMVVSAIRYGQEIARKTCVINIP